MGDRGNAKATGQNHSPPQRPPPTPIPRKPGASRAQRRTRRRRRGRRPRGPRSPAWPSVRRARLCGVGGPAGRGTGRTGQAPAPTPPPRKPSWAFRGGNCPPGTTSAFDLGLGGVGPPGSEGRMTRAHAPSPPPPRPPRASRRSGEPRRHGIPASWLPRRGAPPRFRLMNPSPLLREPAAGCKWIPSTPRALPRLAGLAGVAPGHGPVTPQSAGLSASAGRSGACSGWARDARGGLPALAERGSHLLSQVRLNPGQESEGWFQAGPQERNSSPGNEHPRLARGGAAPKRAPLLLPPARAASAHAPSFLRTHRGLWTGRGAQVSLRRVGEGWGLKVSLNLGRAGL